MILVFSSGFVPNFAGLEGRSLDKDFAYLDLSLADIQDFVWVDSNRNGLLDASETDIANVTINLLDKQSRAVAATVFARNGSFVFTDVSPGEYSLEVTELRRDLSFRSPPTSQSASPPLPQPRRPLLAWLLSP